LGVNNLEFFSRSDSINFSSAVIHQFFESSRIFAPQPKHHQRHNRHNRWNIQNMISVNLKWKREKWIKMLIIIWLILLWVLLNSDHST